MRGPKSWKKLEKVWYSNHTYLTIPPMDSPQILQFVDEAVYTNTGKRLNNLQRRIIAGILNRQDMLTLQKLMVIAPSTLKRLVTNFCKCYLKFLVNKLRKVILNPS